MVQFYFYREKVFPEILSNQSVAFDGVIAEAGTQTAWRYELRPGFNECPYAAILDHPGYQDYVRQEAIAPIESLPSVIEEVTQEAAS